MREVYIYFELRKYTKIALCYQIKREIAYLQSGKTHSRTESTSVLHALLGREDQTVDTSSFYLSVLTLKCFSSSPYRAILTLKTKAISRMCEIFAVKLHVCVQTFPIMSHKLFLDACFPRRQTCLNFQMLPIRFGYENSSRVSSLEFTIPRNQSNAEILVNVPHVPSGCSMKTRFAKVIIHV